MNVEREKIMGIDFYLGGFACILILGGLWYLVAIVEPKRQEKESRKEKEKRNRKREKDKKEHERWEMEESLPNFFGVEISDNFEDNSKAYDEIVRLVNLEAIRTAISCVKQDKENRGVNKDVSVFFDYDVADQKGSWAKMRNNALKLNPNLKDRLPHFSEFDPLKSYNEEHLLKKSQ